MYMVFIISRLLYAFRYINYNDINAGIHLQSKNKDDSLILIFSFLCNSIVNEVIVN